MKKTSNLLILSTSIFAFIYLLFNIEYLTLSKILVTLSVVPVLFIVKIIRKLFNFNVSDAVEFIFIIFVIFAQLFGSALGYMSEIKHFDKALHLASGILTSIFAICILDNFKLKNRTTLFDIIFIITFTLSVAVCWELFEYTSDLILKGDVQHVLTTGVDDTMQDTICALVGSLLFCLTYKSKRN